MARVIFSTETPLGKAMILLLQQSNGYLTGFNVLMGLLTLIILVGAAIIVLLARKKETISGIQLERAQASEALVKTRDTQLDDCSKRCVKCQEELDDTTAELRAQMGINVSELMKYWEQKLLEQAQMENIKQENRILRLRVGEPLK